MNTKFKMASLALAVAGAVAFIGSVQAQENVHGKYYSANGDSLTVTDALGDGVERVTGGYYNVNSGTDTDLSVQTGIWSYLSGGNVLKDHTEEVKFTAGTLNTTISGDAAVTKTTAGGHHIIGVSKNLTLSTETANLTISGGTFGHQDSTGNVPEDMVLAGDMVKNPGNYGGNGAHSETTTIGTTNLTISGGTFNAPVLGGSASIIYYGHLTDGNVLSTHVDNANITITGGTFNGAIIAGGLSWGQETKSSVGKASIVIDGTNAAEGTLNINCDIFAGGLISDPYPGSSAVGTTDIVIKNAKVQNIYGTNARTNVTADGNGNDTWYYTPSAVPATFALARNTSTATNTHVTIINSTVEGLSVDQGSVELRVEDTNGNQGSVTIGNMNLGASTTVSLSANGAANDRLQGNVDNLMQSIQVGNGSAGNAVEGAQVNLEQGFIYGATSATVGANGTVENVVIAENTTQDNVMDMANGSILTLDRLLANDLRKRMGDLRASSSESGVWARYDGGRLSGSSNLETDFNTIQIGVDTVPTPDAPRFGLAFSYTKGDSDMDKGSADMEAFSLAAYGTYLADNGVFVDVIGRMAKIDTDMTVDGVDAKLDNLMLSLSGEVGYRYEFARNYYVEPSVELT